MTKLTLTTVGSTLTNTAATQINANNTAIVTAMENTLSRDGTTPNQMAADIDLNSNDLLNVGVTDTDVLKINGAIVQAVDLATALKTSNNLSELTPTAATARANIGLVIGTDVQAFRLVGSATFDPPSLADGAGTTTTITVTGAALGDFAIPSFSLDLQGITVTAYVSSANTCTVRFQNESGGVLDLASGTLRVAVFK